MNYVLKLVLPKDKERIHLLKLVLRVVLERKNAI